jgi:hypothetical protein
MSVLHAAPLRVREVTEEAAVTALSWQAHRHWRPQRMGVRLVCVA